MIINDIEYNIRLYVDDETTGAELAEEVFENFGQMNAYIDKTCRKDEFLDAKAVFTFVEVINGNPEEAGEYFFDVAPYQPLLDDEVEEIVSEMGEESPEKEAIRLDWEENLSFKPSVSDNEPGDISKAIPLSEYSYICPHCFNEVQMCTCKSYPYNLIQIDKRIVPIIKELNLKGYRTMYCCAGHPGFSCSSLDMCYISFDKNYIFSIPFPEGSKYSKSAKKISFCVPEEQDISVLKAYQHQCIEKLLKWSQELPLREQTRISEE